jgi:hypothetical protein
VVTGGRAPWQGWLVAGLAAMGATMAHGEEAQAKLFPSNEDLLK